MKKTKLTQRQLAGGYIRTWLAGEIGITEFIERLTSVIDKTGMCPPLGKSDDSLSVAQRTALANYRGALCALGLSQNAVLDALGLDEEGYSIE